ncbi:MAG: hypothetical protein ABJG47_10705 [Ekhidna sp.]
MHISRKSEGLDLDVWINKVTETYDQHSSLFPLEPKALMQLYQQDYSVEEAVLKFRSKGRFYTYMELHVHHEHGRYSTTFRTEDQAREFFSKFPEIRKGLVM